MSETIRRFGWIKDVADWRDFKYTPRLEILAKLPEKIDLRPNCPHIYDQGNLGSCTAQAIAAAYAFQELKQGMPDPDPSRLFVYYNERVIEDTVYEDAGAQIRDGIKSVVDWGVCPETDWPYVIDRYATRPDDSCYEDALKDQVLQYMSIDNNLDQLRGAMAEGHPVIGGIVVYSNFPMDTTTGDVPMPKCLSKILGGHAILLVGYDNSLKRFYFRNSWGVGWGEQGYGSIPFRYLSNPALSDDFWVLRLVE